MIRLKSKEDIDGIRKSCRLLAKTFKMLRPHIVEGCTGLELDRIALDFIRAHGGKPAFLNYDGFPNTLCISPNDAVIHGIPNKTAFKTGDLISIDCGIILNGYVSDSAYTYAIGPVPDRVALLMKTAEESLYLGIAEAKAGNRVHDISRAVFRHNRKEGFGIVKPFCGHGVGFEVHEEPQIPNYVSAGANPRLKPGMVIAIEPMVNLGGDGIFVDKDGWTVRTNDHQVSAHYEHTIAILEDRVEILTTLEEEQGTSA